MLIEKVATCLFVIALLHTFASSVFKKLATRYPEGSLKENLFHLIGEVEVVFGLWAGVLIVAIAIFLGSGDAVHYAESLNYTEPLFVFAIMATAATRPIIWFAEQMILLASKAVPLSRPSAIYVSSLIVGPLMGSFITEPAAMTVTAYLMLKWFMRTDASARFKYMTLAALFVNVSIGGVLTPYAAPPVLMVAAKWNWDLTFMLSNFGWKAALACVFNALFAWTFLRNELQALRMDARSSDSSSETKKVPWILVLIHLFFLGMIVASAHHPVIFFGFFLFFMGVVTITQEYQDSLKLKESLLVSFFLAGLVVLGGMQGWWLEPLVQSLDVAPLFVGATALTAITDNAALTYLGSQAQSVTASYQYALVAGAVAGGGLTVIANAPNPAGYSILQDCFDGGGISALKLFLAALPPTLIAMACFWLL